MHGGKTLVGSGTEGGYPEGGYPQRWSAMAVLCGALFVLGIDHTILNTALPRLALALQPTSAELIWIVDAFVLTFAGLLLVGGTLGDRFGRKHALLVGLLVFGAGSAVAAWAGSPTKLIAGRGLMGVGAALIMPATLSTVTNMFPASERTRAIAIWAAIPVLGIVVGPLVSGFLLEHFWWGSVMLINLPLIPLLLMGTLHHVPETRSESRPRVDVLGAGLSFAALTLLIYSFIEVTARSWTDARVLEAAGAAALVFLAFLLWERRARRPMIDLSLFRDARFSAASGALTLAFFGMSGMVFALVQYLQFVLGFSPLQAGVRLLPIAISSTIGSLLSARLVKPLGRRFTVAGGLALTAAGLAVMSLVDHVGGYGIVAVAQSLLGAGLGLSMTPATDSIMEAVPPEKAGVGSAVNDTTRELGGALGVAVLGSVLASAYSSGMADAVRGLPSAAAAAARDTLPAATEIARTLSSSEGSALLQSAATVFAEAMSSAVLVGAAVAMIGALLALVFIPSRRVERLGRETGPESSSEPSREGTGLEPRGQEAYAGRTTA